MANAKLPYWTLLSKIEGSAGSNNKVLTIRAIKAQADAGDEQSKFALDYLKAVVDPNYTTNVTEVPSEPRLKTAATAAWMPGDSVQYPAFRKLLDGTPTRNAKVLYDLKMLIFYATEAEAAWLNRFLKKDGPTGVGVGLLNKAIPGSVAEFEVALCEKPDKKHPVTFPCWASYKLDGIRCLAFVDNKNQTVTYKTRNGKPIDVQKKFDEALLRLTNGVDVVFDGELCGATFKEVMEQARRKKQQDVSRLVYHVFDVVTQVEFASGKFLIPIEARINTLEGMQSRLGFGGPVTFVPHLMCCDQGDLDKVYKVALGNQLEGVVVKQPIATYHLGRSYSWMKIKPTDTYDCKVVGMFPGQGKYTHVLGGLIVEYNGVTTEVGSGFTDVQRYEIWNGPEEDFIGKTVEVKAQEIIPETGKFRFPIFVQMRPDK